MTLSNYGKCLRTTPLYMTEVNYKLDVSFLCLTFVSGTLTFTNLSTFFICHIAS